MSWTKSNRVHIFSMQNAEKLPTDHKLPCHSRRKWELLTNWKVVEVVCPIAILLLQGLQADPFFKKEDNVTEKNKRHKMQKISLTLEF